MILNDPDTMKGIIVLGLLIFFASGAGIRLIAKLINSKLG